MKKNFKSLLVLAMIFSMFVATFGIPANTNAEEVILDSEGNEVSEAEIEELAAQLEFVHAEAIIFDDEGNFLGFDIEKIEQEYGSDLGISNIDPNPVLTSDPGMISIQSAAVDRCINNKIKANYGATFKLATYQTILTYLYQRQFQSAAKALIKVGVKGNAATIGFTLSFYFFSCLPLKA